MSKRRVWSIYLVIVAGSYATFFAWASWRSDTCRACSAPVRLDHPGLYRTESRWFAEERYMPSFLVDGPVPASFEWYDHSDQHLWQGSPPEIEIEVKDAANRTLLREHGAIQRDHDWIVSGTYGAGPVEVYKFTDFIGAPFRKYFVTVRVLRGSPAASTYNVTFRFSRICEYEGLERIMEFASLSILALIAAAVIAVVLKQIKKRAPSHAP